MSIKNSLIIISLSALFISCGTDYNFKLKSPKKININKKLLVSFFEKNDYPIDSVLITLDKNIIKLDGSFNATINISDYKLGKHIITALVFYDGKTKKVSNTLYFLADSKPAIYDFKIINSYPHDKKAYTQGLEIHDGFLYESTGKPGFSSLRKVVLETGEIVKQIDLDSQYFGEGFTKIGNEIFMLTWKKGIGFIYDFETFEQKGTFNYNKEGWGFTNDGGKLIKTDGSEHIQFLDPKTKKIIGHIEAYTNERKVEKLNELEYINGKIYANIYGQNSILIINPKTGKVEGVANLNGLKNEMGKTQKLVPQDEVLNGIAFDKKTKKLYVTGKNWEKLFEIELIKKE